MKSEDNKKDEEIKQLRKRIKELEMSESDRKQAERTLRKSENILAQAEKLVHLGSFEWNVQRNLVYYSDEMYRIWGYEPLEFIPTYEFFFKTLHPDDIKPVKEALNDTLTKKGPYNIEYCIKTKNGQERIINAQAEVEFDNKEKPVRMFGTALDITERKQAEEAIRESEEKFSKAFHATSNLIAISTIKEGRFIDTNEAYARLIGYTREELVGHTSVELNILADPKQRKEIIQMLQEGRPVQELEVGIRTKSGEIRTVLFSADRITLKGDPCFLGMAIDITVRKEIEEQLRESEEFNKKIIESSYDCIKLLDLNGNLLFMSAGGQKIMEIEDETTVLNKSWIDSWKGEDNEKVTDAVSKAKNGLIGQFQGYCPTQKGTPKYWDVIISPICDIEGKVIQLLSISRDITEHKHSEEVLKESEEKYRLLFENMSEGFVLHEIITDVKGHPCDFRFLEMNPACERLTGLSSKKVIGHLVSEIVIELSWIERYGRVGLSGKPEHFQDYSTKLKRWYEVFAYQNEPGQCAAIFTDITERKKAEEELFESEVRFRGVFESSMSGTLFWNADGDITDSNDTFLEMVGYTRDEILSGKVRWRDMTPPEFKEQDDEMLRQLIKTGKANPIEKEYIRKDGRRIPILLSAAVLPGETIHGVAFIVDITERKQAEEELRGSEDRYRQIFNNSAVALWEMDFSAVREYVEELKNQGMEDLHEHIASSPELIREIQSRIKLLDVNDTTLSVFKASTREKLYNSFGKLMTDSSNRSFLRCVKEFDSGKLFYNSEQYHKSIDGEDLIVDLTATIIPGSEETWNRILITINDITERKKAEEELRLKNLVFEVSIAANSTADNKGIITHANSAFLGIWGYDSIEEVIGKPILHFLKNEEEAVGILTALNETGAWEGEYTALKKDGSTFIAYGLATTILNEKGEQIGVQSAVLDITEQKQAEEELQKLKDELEIKVAEQTKELRKKVNELERFRDATVNREFRMKELRDEIEKLKSGNE